MKFYMLYILSAIKNRPKTYISKFIVIFASILLISVISITIDSINLNEILLLENAGLDYHFYGKAINEGAHFEIENNPNIKILSSDSYIAINNTKELFFKDISEYKNDFSVLKGASPIKNEILIPFKYLSMLPEGTDIGTKIQFTLNINGHDYEKDFIVSGFYSSEENNKIIFFIGAESAQEIYRKSGNKKIYSDYIKLLNIYDKISFRRSFEMKFDVLLEENQTMDYVISGGVKKAFLIFLMVLTTLICILIIFNVINIENKNRSFDFGMFLSLGATPKQIFCLGIIEILLLMVIVLPAGIFISIPICRFIFNNNTLLINFSEGKIVYSCFINLKTILRTIFFSATAVIAASLIPLSKIAYKSPIEIVKGKFVRNIFNVRNSSELGIQKKHPEIWLATLNLKRDKDQIINYSLIFMLSILLFISVFHFIDYYNKGLFEKYDKGIIHINYFGNEGIVEINSYIDKIKKLEGVISVQPQDKGFINNFGDENISTTMISALTAENLSRYIVKGNINEVFMNDFSVAILDNNNKYNIGDIIQNIVPLKDEENHIMQNFKIVCTLKDKNFDQKNNIYLYTSNKLSELLPNSYCAKEILVYCENSEIIRLQNEIHNADKTGLFDIVNLKKFDEIELSSIKIMIEIISFLTVFLFFSFIFIFIFIRNNYIKYRRKEFGILKAIGMTQKDIEKIVYIESGMYGVLSSFISIMLSLIPVNLLHKAIFKSPFMSVPRYNIFIYIYVSITALIINYIIIMFCLKQIKNKDTIETIRDLE